jgi:uncharacterized protein
MGDQEETKNAKASPREAVLLRVFVGEDKHLGRHQPIHEVVALRARQAHMAGVTVMRGMLGFGRSTRLHTAKVIMSDDLPVVVEIIDTAEKIDGFLGVIADLPHIALITREKVEILHPADPEPGLSTFG